MAKMMRWIRSHSRTKAALLAVIATFVGVAVLVFSSVSRSDATQQTFKETPPIPSAVNLTLALTMVLIGGYLKFVPRQNKPEAQAREPAAAIFGPRKAAPHENATKKLPF